MALNPTSVSALEQASQDFDLRPIIVHQVSYKNGVLRFRVPLTFHPYYGEARELFRADNKDLRILAAGITREELIEDIYDEIRNAWQLIAQVEDVKLTQRALITKRNLHQAIEEV